jgi:hypothetical protein
MRVEVNSAPTDGVSVATESYLVMVKADLVVGEFD